METVIEGVKEEVTHPNPAAGTTLYTPSPCLIGKPSV